VRISVFGGIYNGGNDIGEGNVGSGFGKTLPSDLCFSEVGRDREEKPQSFI